MKSRTMSGFDSPYVPGWDCHGLPIEIKVDQQLGGKKLQMDPKDVRLECRKYAQKFLDLQREQFKRIGVFGRFDDPYSTMTPQYESVVIDIFYRFFENNFVYKGLRSVYWCIHDKTALAEAEVEYENHTSPTVWVKYALQATRLRSMPALKGKKVFTIIWTTTPWTLPASMAVAFHPDEEYVALESGDEVYIVAAQARRGGRREDRHLAARKIARFPGRKTGVLLNSAIRFWIARSWACWRITSPWIRAPAWFTRPPPTVRKTSIPARNTRSIPLQCGRSGIMRNGLPEYDGKQVFKANAPIVELLKSRGVLMHTEKLEHSYPHCWRCHNPIIFRATEQWFISMETPMEGRDVAQRDAR